MQGRQEYQPKLFSIIDIEKRIPRGHLLRRIDRVLDLSFVREMTQHLYCQDNGRLSIDPELFFRICLITHLYDIPSDRQVCEELDYNLAYKWFCRLNLEDSVPDHSSLTKIRDRLGEETFKKIFEHIIKVCVEKGLAKGNKVMMDGSLIKADAALNSLVAKNADGTASDKEPPKYIIGQKYSNNTHVSQTDPDATLAGKTGEPKQLRHKVHNTIDRDSRVIIDTHVTTGSAVEGNVMMSRVDFIEKTFGFDIEELTGDRGYGYGVNLNELEKRGITSYVPNFHSEVGENIDYDLYKYDKERDVFICPAGHLLERKSSDETEQKDYARRYQIRSFYHCYHCPLNNKCYPDAPPKPGSRKGFVRNIFWELQAKTKEREKTPEFRAVRGERQWKMEGIFAEAKDNHGLGRARYRGRAKVQIQAYMIATVQNLKRLLEASEHLADFLCSCGHLLRKNSVLRTLVNFFVNQIQEKFTAA